MRISLHAITVVNGEETVTEISIEANEVTSVMKGSFLPRFGKGAVVSLASGKQYWVSEDFEDARTRIRSAVENDARR